MRARCAVIDLGNAAAAPAGLQRCHEIGTRKPTRTEWPMVPARRTCRESARLELVQVRELAFLARCLSVLSNDCVSAAAAHDGTGRRRLQTLVGRRIAGALIHVLTRSLEKWADVVDVHQPLTRGHLLSVMAHMELREAHEILYWN